MSSFVKVRGPRRHAHKELVNIDGPSQIERGDISSIDLRDVVALRAAIDDALNDVATRFNLKYRVLRGRFGVDGAEYRIGLEVKDRPSTVYRTDTALIVPSATPGKPIGSARMPKPPAAK